MITAAASLARLTEAQLSHEPACLNDERFTAEQYTTEEVLRLAETCARCLIFDRCEDYAEEARPSVGVWAGRRYKNNYTRKEEAR